MDQTGGFGAERELSAELDVFPPPQQRRWTVLLRLILAIPHLVVLWALSIATFFVALCGWFGALFTGRLPQWCGDFLRSYIAYLARVSGYLMLMVDVYPPFSLDTAADYPVRTWFPPPTELNRAAVLFRLILAIPILALTSWFMSGWAFISLILWLIVLITGRMPRTIFEATAAILRIQLRVDTYFYMLSPTYLKGVFGDGPEPPPGTVPLASPTRPLFISQGARILMIVMLIIGILSGFANSVTSSDDTNDDSTSQYSN